MVWDITTHRAITLARLKALPPAFVYKELDEYGAHLELHGAYSGDDELELALAGRNDPLINLGLAKNASKATLVADLYNRARHGSGDAQYDLGVRLACLANRVAPQMLFGQRFASVEDGELRRLALEGESAELLSLMLNPSAGGVLRDVYARKAPFDDISDERWRLLVWASVGNRRLNIDESNAHGPDLLAWDLQKNIFGLLQLAPVSAEWLRTLYHLLVHLKPESARPPAAGEAASVLDRWSDISVSKLFGPNDEDEEGEYTALTFAQEFRCLVASLYGRTLASGKFDIIGTQSDTDVALRCAYYGNATPTLEQMRVGFGQDKDVFSFAALFNDNILLKPELRGELEKHLARDQLRLYSKRCEQLAERWKWFNPLPLSESAAAALDILRDAPQTQANNGASVLANVEAQLIALKSQVDTLTKISTWGLVILAALMLYRH